jgi:adenosylmethionine-8-amino-7-oxononanoate aminotransferase
MESGAQIAGGLVIYPRGYQKKIMELCRKYNVLLILDEIATGFGRLGSIIEYKAQKSAPDIACFGKALTAGYFPLAVTLATGEIYDAFLGEVSQNKQLYHGHTFTGHPVGCSAAIANIELYEKRNLMRLIGENSRYISYRLREFSESPIVGDIRHKGMLAGVELVKNSKPINYVRKDLRIGRFVMHESLKRGVFLRSLGNILMIIPPLAIGNRNLKKIMDVQLEILGLIEKEKISGNVRP